VASKALVAAMTMLAVSAIVSPVLGVAVALFDRFESRGEADFANKIPSAMRKQFGGTPEKTG
jgi:6-phosphogluconate dehydrogenase